MDKRVFILIAVGIASAFYGFYHSLPSVRYVQEEGALESNTNSQPVPAPQKKPVVTEAPALDIQLQQQAAINATSNSLKNGNPEDENLVTETASTDAGTPYPSKKSFRLDERGELLMELDFGGAFFEHKSIARRYNPVTGEMKTLLSLSGYYIERGLIADKGILFFVAKNAFGKQGPSSLVFIDNDGKASAIELKIMRSEAKLLLLSDQSVLLFGGRNITEQRERNNSFELVQIKNGVIDVQSLPDVIDPKLWGYSLVALPDARALLMGGTNYQYINCQEPNCSKKTYILDASAKTWSDGPSLNEPHADAEASVLADGSVVIAGGWRANKSSNPQVSTISERWSPTEPAFKLAAPLPIPVAKMRSVAADAHTPFMLIGEEDGYVQAYDAKNNEWRLVASFYGADNQYGLGPFGDKQNFYLLINAQGEKNTWQKVALGISPVKGDFFSSSFTPNLGGYFYNNEVNYLPPNTNQLGVIAGAASYGSPNTSATAVSAGGDLTPLATLNHPRINAQLFRLPNGAIVVAGGVPEDENKNNTDSAPPLELLIKPDISNHWKILNITHPLGTRYGQAANGDLIVLLPDGSLEQIAFDLIDAEPRIIKTTLGRMINPREYFNDSPIVLRGVAEGKIIISGGCIREHQIAVVYDKPAPDTEEGSGNYEDVANLGTCSPNNSYDIYTPNSRTWRKSVDARYSESKSVILGDGRVARMSELQVSDPSKSDITANTVVEISNSEGSQWKIFIGDEAPRVKFHSAKLFVVDEEIFIGGTEQLAAGNGENFIVQWFDVNKKHWVTVWNRESRSEKSPVTLAQVKLPNQKIVILPTPH